MPMMKCAWIHILHVFAKAIFPQVKMVAWLRYAGSIPVGHLIRMFALYVRR